MRGFRQGDLDGLCGPYSVVNAARRVGRLDAETCGTLFDAILRRVGDARRVTAGIGRGLMDEILRDVAGPFFHTRYMPFRTRPDVPLSLFWSTLAEFVGDEDGERPVAAIVCVDTPIPHWTTVTGVTDHRLRLVDSDRLKVLVRRRCTTGPATAVRPWRLWPTRTYLLS